MCLLIFLVAAFVSQWTHRQTLSNGKSAKVLFMANCGMRVATDIGVIRDDGSRLYRYFWRGGYDVRKRVYLERHGAQLVAAP